MDRYDPAPAASTPEQDKKPAKATTKAGNRVATSKAQGKARATSTESKQERALTRKQEAFCLAYLETGNASEAYRQVYNTGRMKDATINRAAKQLMDNYKITTRLSELRQPAIESAQMTLESHLADLKRIRDLALAAEEYSAAITAETNRGKASGFYTNKHEHTGADGDPIQHSLAVHFVKSQQAGMTDDGSDDS